jgi:hypothetical protein
VGGLGSGQWYRWNKRRTIEDCRRLDVRLIHRSGVFEQPGFPFLWEWKDQAAGETTASIRLRYEPDRVVLSFRFKSGGGDWDDLEQIVPLSWTPCNYGGHRPWFLCPGFGCGRRVAVLVAGGRRFLCRHCYRLTYASTSETEVDRLFRRANKIRGKLGGKPGMAYEFPPRPKGMHHATYERIRLEATSAEEIAFSEGLIRFGLSPDGICF